MNVELFSDTGNTKKIIFTVTKNVAFKMDSIFLSSDGHNTKKAKAELLLDGVNVSGSDFLTTSFNAQYSSSNRSFTAMYLPANAVIRVIVEQVNEPLSNVKIESIILTNL